MRPHRHLRCGATIPTTSARARFTHCQNYRGTTPAAPGLADTAAPVASDSHGDGNGGRIKSRGLSPWGHVKGSDSAEVGAETVVHRL